MTKNELNTIFQAIHEEMIEDCSVERLVEKLQESVAHHEAPQKLETIIPHVAMMTMDYNKEFLFRVLLKALEKV